MYDGTASQLRNKYLSGSLSSTNNREYPRSSDVDYCVDNLELENIYQKKAIRLELELAELRRENDQLKQSNQQLKSSESLRNTRMHNFEQEKYVQLQRERDDIMRDVTDLARGNRLLSQENDILSQKYSNLLDVYNKVILNNNSASKLAEVYSNQIEGRTRILKDYTKEKWEEFSELAQEYENNKRKINEMYATLKGKLMHLQTDSQINYDTKEQWKHYAEDVQEVFDQVFRLSQGQNDLHQKIIINQQAKNRELQQKLEEQNIIFPKNANGNTQPQNEFNQKEIQNIAQNLMGPSRQQSNGLASIQESKNEDSKQYLTNNAYLNAPQKESSELQDKLSQSSKRPKTASVAASDAQKKTIKKSTSSVKPVGSKVLESKTKIPLSPSKTKLPSPSKTNLLASKKPSMSKVASVTSISQNTEAVNKLTKSKIISPSKTNIAKMASSTATPKINVLSVPK